MFDLMMSLSMAMDLINPALANHHKQVAYIAHSLAVEHKCSFEQQKNIVLAGAAHDIGAFSLRERLELKQFAFANPHQHAEFGYRLLKTMTPLSEVAVMVRFHHVNWNRGQGEQLLGEAVPLESHILHLADRIASLIDCDQTILSQVPTIVKAIESVQEEMFHPQLVEYFRKLSDREYFWLDLTSNSIHYILKRKLVFEPLALENLHEIARLFSHIIDFRSPFTATHSSGLAAAASTVSRLLGFSGRECQMMEIAGYLHDLGKLAVPAEILEKPSRLSKEDVAVMRAHTYYTYRILEPIEDLREINAWASFHHERIDGRGYPFQIKGEDLSLGARILAVADVFTAVTENRPYRKGLGRAESLSILTNMAANGAIDPTVVELVKVHFDQINLARETAQSEAHRAHEEFFNGG